MSLQEKFCKSLSCISPLRATDSSRPTQLSRIHTSTISLASGDPWSPKKSIIICYIVSVDNSKQCPTHLKIQHCLDLKTEVISNQAVQFRSPMVWAPSILLLAFSSRAATHPWRAYVHCKKEGHGASPWSLRSKSLSFPELPISWE